MNDKRAVFLLGSRRVGKTILIFQTIYRLIREGMNPSSILFLSMDQVQLKGVDLVQVITEGNFSHVFLDEIHALDQWQQTLKSLYDLPGRRFQLVCSGSSSFLIRDHKSFLTGRGTSLLMHGLSFTEFQTFAESKGYPADLMAYLEHGGYPEYVLERVPTYHGDLLHDILEKDIVARYKIRHRQGLRDLLKLVAKQTGFKTSVHKLSKVLSLSDDTVRSYLTHLEDVSVLMSLPQYSPSVNERIYSSRKYYFADTGLRNHHTGFEDFGALAESAVCDALRRRYNPQDLFYQSGQAHSEVDFVIHEKEKITLMEVKFSRHAERILAKLSPLFFRDLPDPRPVERVVITDGLDEMMTIKERRVRLVSAQTFLSSEGQRP